MHCQSEAEKSACNLPPKALEAELKASGVVIKKKNWPICVPILHHDIPGDIPEKSRRVVREVYMCWCVCVCVCVSHAWGVVHGGYL